MTIPIKPTYRGRAIRAAPAIFTPQRATPMCVACGHPIKDGEKYVTITWSTKAREARTAEEWGRSTGVYFLLVHWKCLKKVKSLEAILVFEELKIGGSR